MKAVSICYGILAVALAAYALTGYGTLITIGCLPGVCVFIYYLSQTIKQMVRDYLG